MRKPLYDTDTEENPETVVDSQEVVTPTSSRDDMDPITTTTEGVDIISTSLCNDSATPTTDPEHPVEPLEKFFDDTVPKILSELQRDPKLYIQHLIRLREHLDVIITEHTVPPPVPEETIEGGITDEQLIPCVCLSVDGKKASFVMAWVTYMYTGILLYIFITSETYNNLVVAFNDYTNVFQGILTVDNIPRG